MTWQNILKNDKTLMMFKRGLYFSTREETTLKGMCKAGKDHIENEIRKLNINKEVPHDFIEGETVNVLVAVTAGAFGGAQAEDEMSGGGGLPKEYRKYHKDLKRIFKEGIEVCKKSKKNREVITETKVDWDYHYPPDVLAQYPPKEGEGRREYHNRLIELGRYSF